MKAKIVIEVSGGNVQNVFANCTAEIVLIDHDNMAAEGKNAEERERAMVEACAGLSHVF